MKFRPQFDSLVFDLDGTLWDASEPISEAWNRVLTKAQVNLQVSAQDIRSVSGLPFHQCVEVLLSSVPERKRPPKEEFDRAENEMLLKTQGGKLFPSVATGLERLQKEYPLFLVSNCQDWYLDLFLSLPDVQSRFRESLCYGTSTKPKNQNLLELRKKHSLQRPLYIGDTQWDQDASFSAGIPFLFVEYGFGKVNLKRTPSVRSFKELTQLFLISPEKKPLITTRALESNEFALAKEFYKLVGYVQPLSEEHFFVTAWCEGEMIGIVRLVMEEEVWVLRGMQVRPDFQFYGVGTKLLRALEPHLVNRECYGIPYAWLEKFYSQIGFQRVDAQASAPTFLLRRLEDGLQSNNKLILMRRPLCRDESV